MRFKDLSENALVELRNVFVLYVKLPKPFWPFIERSEKNDDLGMRLRKRLFEIHNDTVWINNGWYEDNGLEEKYLDELNKLSLI